jgi:hypothetical protein
MLNRINLYIIIGLFALLIALGGSFYAYHRISSSEIAALEQQTTTYRLAVESSEATIAKMKTDAELLAKANAMLTDRFIQSEADLAASWSAINELDLMTDADPPEAERRINEAFAASIDELRRITTR